MTVAKASQDRSEDKEKAFEPVTFWLADPTSRQRLYLGGAGQWIVFNNGKYVAKTKEHADLIEDHLPGVAFKQDLDEPIDPEGHPVSGYKPLSKKAYAAHNRIVTPVQG